MIEGVTPTFNNGWRQFSDLEKTRAGANHTYPTITVGAPKADFSRQLNLDLVQSGKPRSKSKSPDAYVQLEAMLLRNLVGTMFVKDESAVFGAGLAGEYWQSMLSDQIADSLAQTGKLGIAENLRRNLQGSSSVQGGSSASNSGVLLSTKNESGS